MKKKKKNSDLPTNFCFKGDLKHRLFFSVWSPKYMISVLEYFFYNFSNGGKHDDDRIASLQC